MSALIWMIFLFLAVVVWPWWMIRRMRWVRAQSAAESRAKLAEKPYQPNFIEGAKGADGLTYGRDTYVNEQLIEADKNASSMPDIVKTLEGRR
jgi:DNA-dependent RNA polymerase auxiliary subunit epsilon